MAERNCCYCAGAGKFQITSACSDGAWAACFCSRNPEPALRVISGKDVKAVLHDIALDPKATADEKHRLGFFVYYLTGTTADRIAAKLEERRK